VLKWAPVTDQGEFRIEDFEALISPRTKMIAITHMSNVLGTIVPLKEVVKLAHARGIPVLADGAQAAVHMPVDVQDLDVDFYSFTGHKLYGPTGIGVLYGKEEHLAAMRPYQGGGEMIGTVTCDRITYAKPPHRFEAGTPAIVQAIGLGAAIDYVEGVGRERIRAHENALLAYAMERLDNLPWLRIFGRAKHKGSIISFEMDGAHAHDVSTILDRYGVAVRAGTHCAEPLLARFGVTSTARASFAMYNSFEEVDTLVAALIKAREMFV
jgi:cysteine desulfurase/selenocysteine lyase